MEHRRLKLLVAAAAMALLVATVFISYQGRNGETKRKSTYKLSLAAYRGDRTAEAELRQRSSGAVPELIRLLQYEEPARRQFLIRIQRSMPAYTHQHFGKFIGPSGAEVRTSAARALGIIGPSASNAAPHLLNHLDTLSQARIEAALALAAIGPAAVSDLRAALASGSENAQWGAAYALGQMGTNAAPAVPELVLALESTNQYVSASAGYALTRIGPEGPNRLKALQLRSNTNRVTRAAAWRAMMANPAAFAVAETKEP